MAEPTGADSVTATATPADGAGVHDADYGEGAPSEYTTESPEEAPAREPRRQVPTGQATGTGRRKEAIARVRLVPGTGQWRINGRPLDAYFPNKVHQQVVSEPFVTLAAQDQFDVFARVDGGGITGQAGALRMGVARALTRIDVENRPSLKRSGFLTRDAREKERKKYGLKKARKAPQYSKR